MEPIRDIDRHMLCTADPNSGILEHTSRKDRLLIRMPIGGETIFVKEKSLTIIRREGHSRLNVYRYRRDGTG